MNLLERLERRVEGLVEGLFSRAFKGPPHPVEVARALARVMDERAIVSLSRTYAPNEFRVALNPQEFETWAAVASAIGNEMRAYLVDYAAERQYVPPAPLQVAIVADEEVPPGTFRVDAALNRPSPTEGDADFAPGDDMETQIFQAPDAAALTSVLVTQHGARYPLGAAVTVGRGEHCAIVLDDAAASREHARIEPSPDGYVLLDLGSKNGTYVNGERIDRHVMRPGDRIRIGTTTLDFRLEEA